VATKLNRGTVTQHRQITGLYSLKFLVVRDISSRRHW